MKRLIPFLSLALNLILLGAIFFEIRTPAEKISIQSARDGSNGVVTQSLETVLQANLSPQAAPAPFDWSAIKSEDFLAYAENLRGVGCPEQTVRDILTAGINGLFVYRRQDLLRPLQSQFWDLMARGGVDKLVPEEAEKMLDALEEKKKILLKKVFRAAAPEEKDGAPSEYETVMGNSLSPEKIRRLQELNEKFLKSLEEIETSVLPESEKEEKIAALAEQSVADKKSILSPEELDEYKLRTSPFAQELQNCFGFRASEAELRTMAQLSLSEKAVSTDEESPQYETQLAEQRKEKDRIDREMKALLGEDRFKEYERAKDSHFQNLRHLGRRYDLSSQTISEVYELTRSIHEEVRAFKKSNVDSEERDDALEAMRQRTEQAMIIKLGERAAETYRRNFNNWDEIPDP